VTTYWSDGTTFHDGIVVLVRVEGLGAGWNPELLDLKCERILLSIFRHSSALNLPLKTPT
jgi:hypothetical protein